MNLSFLFVLWFWVAIPDPLDRPANWEGTKEESYIKFNIRNLGLNVEGIFNSFTTSVEYDKSHPTKSRFSAKIEVSSLSTGINKRDNHLKQEEYFHLEKYPTITFQSTDVSAPNAGQLLVKGNITIKGTTQPIELKVAVKESGGKTQFSIVGQLDRKDFGVGGNSWVMSDEVILKLYIEN
ncbi:YceI family protein [Lunatibacter salilacus]|uniref:YceI family protein n=1 Tax=Lunatibacter salilacus TaxID=2483804 RepID=UPI00131E9604|nr:YceI family protein [Lunatibacter salilacus]